MQLKAVTLKEKLELVEGQTKAGKPYSKQTIIVEDTSGKYPTTIALQAWNDVCKAIAKVGEGTVMDVTIKIESREYNGRWYTDASIQQFSTTLATSAVEANDLPWE